MSRSCSLNRSASAGVESRQVEVVQVLLRAGVVRAEPRGRQRVYTLDPAALQRVEAWLAPFRAIWSQRLDALETEVQRTRRDRRRGGAAPDRQEKTA